MNTLSVIHTNRRSENTLKYAIRLIEAIPPHNRPTAERYVLLKLNGRRSANTVYNSAKAINYLAESLGPRTFQEVTEDDLLAHVARLGRRLNDNSLVLTCSVTRAFLKHVLDTDSLPRRLKAALKVKMPRPGSTRKPVTPDELEALLRTANTLNPPTLRVRAHAILATLRWAGLRASELLALNVGSLQMTSDGGAFLQLPADGQHLKTGPRRPYVVECVPALQAWLTLHPNAGNPDAPLFPAARGQGRTSYASLLIMIRNLARKAGIRHIHPHLFRHTRATEMARNGWREPLANKQMGWSPKSRMWADYTHLTDEDLINQVRRDAGADPLGKTVQQDPQAALSQAVATAVSETLRQTGLAPRQA